MWAIDGTFDVVPQLYTQLMTIHGITRDGFVFPLVYALLPDKTAASYTYVLDQLINNSLGWVLRPEMVLMDFEHAEIKAVHDNFPDAIMQGCHFHYTQALFRHLTPKLKKLYEQDLTMALTIKKVFGLPFVQPDDVRMAFREVKAECTFKGETKLELDDFFAYVQKTYTGTVYDPPMFPILFCNVHQRVLDNIPRTNNAVEAWNRRFGILAESSHVPLYKIMILLQREEKCRSSAQTEVSRSVP